MKDINCRFCELDANKSKVIELFKHCYVMFSNPRLIYGHLLIVPNRHVVRMSELHTDELQEIMHVVNLYCDKVLKFSKGYMIKNNYMPFLEESDRKVNHLHIQIIPRWNQDELFTKALIHENELFKPLTEEEYKEVIEKMDE
jgi:diadenosine tetraphosphate (Ap4A) HIT family hydrolase